LWRRLAESRLFGHRLDVGHVDLVRGTGALLAGSLRRVHMPIVACHFSAIKEAYNNLTKHSIKARKLGGGNAVTTKGMSSCQMVLALSSGPFAAYVPRKEYFIVIPM
jgi:hypothetical protein